MEAPRLIGWKLHLSKFFLIPQRIIMVIMVALAAVNCYTLRNCLSVAIVRMILEKEINTTSISREEVCHYSKVEEQKQVFKINMVQFSWTSAEKGSILGAFYYGYILSHIPGGIWAENYGGKHILGLGTLWTAVLTLLTPIITIKFGYWGIMTLRVLIGIGEGVTFPAINSLLSDWVPFKERSRLGSLAFSGVLFGSMIGTALSGWIISATKRWDVVFYFFGAVGVLWYILYQLLVYSTPDSHPFISDEEYYKLTAEIEPKQVIPCKKIPWMGILTNLPMWSLILAEIGHDWGLFSTILYLPIYMDEILKFNIESNGFLASMPYFFMWAVAMTSAVFCDWLISKNKFSIGFVRKSFTTAAAFGPATFLVLASYSGCNRMLAVTCFCTAMGIMGCYYPGMRVNGLDLSHKYSGVLMAFVNGLGSLSGIISPKVIAYITKDRTMSEWRILYWLTFIILTTTGSFYVIFGSGKTQDFNDPDYKFPGCCKKRQTEDA